MKIKKTILFILVLFAGKAYSGWLGINTASLGAKFSDLSSNLGKWATSNPKQSAAAIGLAAVVGVIAYKYCTRPAVQPENDALGDWVNIDEGSIKQTIVFGGKLDSGDEFTRKLKINKKELVVSGENEIRKWGILSNTLRILKIEFNEKKVNLPKKIQIKPGKLKAVVVTEDGQIYLKNDQQQYWYTGLIV